MIRLLNYVMVFSFISLSNLQADCIKGDCYNGYGTYIFPSGAKYVGNFTSGKAQGKGILYFQDGNKYIGHWQANVREGEGRFIFVEGHEYLGQFRHDKFHGVGTMNYKSGDRYEGHWKNNQPNGLGKYFFNNGERYEGSFLNGRFDGQGSMFYKDGSHFVGFWKNNKKHGAGTLHYNNGQMLTGDWIFGELDNEVLQEVKDKPVYQASNKSHLRNCNVEFCESGQGSFTYNDGSYYEGTFKNGVPEGNCKVLYANGNRYEGAWKNHVPHGEGILYLADGKAIGARWHFGKVAEDLPAYDTPIAKNEVQKEEDNAVKIWAVVIGVGRYQHMPVLRYTDDDAYHFYAFLKSPEGGALADEQVSVLIDEDATRRNVLQTMRNVFLKADENDVVLFYFSGHGLEGSFIPFDYDGYNNRLHHEEIKKILQESHAKHKLVLGDACHSGSLTTTDEGNYLAARAPVHNALQKYYAAFENTKGGMALMMSSRGEEVSLEDGGLRSGVFSHYLIRGLKGEADLNFNNIITVQELYNFVYQKVRTYTGSVQSPTLTGIFDGRMPVGVIRH